MNHQDLVERIRNGAPLDTSSDVAIFARLLDILAALPPEESAGLERKDAGENIVWYAPANCHVSLSRVCYPDGQLYKVFTDAGPGGANGAAWNDDGTVEPSRYVAVKTAAPPTPVPDPPPVAEPDVISLILAQLDRIERKLDERPAPPPIVFPIYEGSIRYLGAFRLVPKA